MLRVLTILLFAVSVQAAKLSPVNGWIACDINGKSVPLYRDVGDSVSCDVPRYANVVSFLTHTTGLLTSKTITLTFYIESTPDVIWTGGSTGSSSCPPWPNMQLYFTAFAGPFNFNRSHRYSTFYWWSGTTRMAVASVDDGSIVTLTADMDPADWGGAWGENGANYISDFLNSAANAKEVGLSFGNGCTGDTGIAVSQGSATIHVLSLTTQ